tara:strand:+ start:4411 stop:4746 length:336 start_codon:yes stop_codon:yes gene_type:complete
MVKTIKLTELRYNELDASFDGLREWIDSDSYTDEERKALKEMLYALDNCERKKTHLLMNITLEGLKALEGEMGNICERLNPRYGSCMIGEWRSMDLLWKKIREELKNSKEK